MLTADQILAAQKANVETLYGLTNKAFEGVEKLIELNLQASKAALAETAETAQAAMSVQDVQELLQLQANLMQPLAEKAASYTRALYEIAQGTAVEFQRAAESQKDDVQSKLMAAFEAATKNAPAGSEAAVAAMKQAVANASNAVESVQKVVKQASDIVESNMNTLASTAMSAAKSAAPRAAAPRAASRKRS